MVCKGIENNDGIPPSCDARSKFHGTGIFHQAMAANCFGRWGRRKQANPKRTNLDDESRQDQASLVQGASCDLKAVGSPDTPSDDHQDHQDQDHTCAHSSSTQHTLGQTATERPISDTEHSETGLDTEVHHDVTQHASNTPCVMLPQETAMLPQQQKEIPNGLEDLPRVTPLPNRKGSDVNIKNADSGCLETEAEKIQELMCRSDTVVIYPEPVSDQEEAITATQNEDVCDIEDEDDTAQCPHCEQTFSNINQLKDHWHSVHGSLSSKHSCPQCAVSFLAKSQLEKHMSLHSPSSQICKICKKTFANVYRLQRHMISHEESSELRKFKCPECGKAFKFKHHLKEHIRIHSGEKPFECQNCGKRFSHSGSYSSHMTSKKCWIVNLKMRGTSPGLASQSAEKSMDKASRTLVPKDGMDLSLASMMYTSGLIPQQFLPFDPATATQMQNQFLAQINGTQHPFLPHLPFPGNPLTNHIYPAMTNLEAFGCLPPPNGMDKDMKMMESLSENATVASKSDEQVAAVQEVVDENQNKEVKVKESESWAHAESEVKKEHNEDMKDDMQAINKVLEIVGATVSQQKQNKEDKGAYSKLTEAKKSSSEDESHTLTALASAATQQLQQLMKENKSDGEDEEKMSELAEESKLSAGFDKYPNNHTCKFCKKTFSSPINLHQHERYLCKQNHEIQRLDPEVNLHMNGIVSPSISCNDDEHSTDSERKIRVRSMITDEQVQILKTFYISNQRPNKYELENLAQQIGFQKRVVQVWFQNMRARDRRKGRNFREAHTDHLDVKVSSVPSSAYIPIVPQVAMPSRSVYCPSAPSTSSSVYKSNASPQQASEATSAADQPLDLTVKRQEAHTNKPFSSRPTPDQAGEVLNLSIKESTDCAETLQIPIKLERRTNSPAPATHITAEHPAQPETRAEARPTSSPLVIPMMSNSPSPLAMSVPLQINTTPAHSRSYASVTSIHQTAFAHQQPAPAHHSTPTRVLYDHAMSPSLVPDVLSPIHSSLDGSFNSNGSMEGRGSPFGLVHKPKRARKKSWRQVGGSMECEEMYDLDESVDEDSETGLARKKRRSWKQHRVDAGDGLYACDQCDKMFSKQSSLARHKYEHSGQRPFPCDICTKAFKHKHHLTEHKRLHSGEKPFQCQKCGKRFSHSGSYSQHMNHRYKYCKPLCGGEMAENCDSAPEMDLETEQSEASP